MYQKTVIYTRNAIEVYRRRNPYATQVEMAQAIGISRERVRQLLKKMGLPAVVKDPAKIPNYYCAACGKPIDTPRSAKAAHKFCDRACYYASRTVTVECFICSEIFPMQLSQWEVRLRRYNTLTCSMECRGVTIGRQVKVVRSKKYWAPKKISENQTEQTLDTNRHVC
jgi:DNA-binding Lrp family transcriptional regulator